MAHQDTASTLSCRSTTVADADVWQALREGQGAPRVFWRDEEGTHIGLGATAVLEAHGPDRFEQVRAQAEAVWDVLDLQGGAATDRLGGAAQDVDAAAPRFWGGFSFHDHHTQTPPWSAFPAARFWMPRRTLSHVEGTWYETVVEGRLLPNGPDRRADGPPDGPGHDRDPSGGEGDGHAQVHAMDRTAWREAVERATDAIQEGHLAKVVLARSQEGPAASKGNDRSDVVDALASMAGGAGLEATFLMEPRAGHRLLGATPELLAAHDGRTVTSHALAGSAPVTGDAAADDAAGKALFRSEKDILEHELVVSFIRERLAGAGLQTDHGARRLRVLETIQHLETPIHAGAGTTHVLDVVRALHPTPAVGGYPRQKSLELIGRSEPFPRGWYAGGVGWFDATGRGRFTVALRCGLVTPDQSWLFAGAGIVAASEADKEWEETEWKMAAMAKALGGDP